ncbi:MAG TPA: MBOAT family protein [Tepidisphaeraceae bacterium]|jgi:alginate O-acetyltransferase complex protein AlgI
MLFTEPEFLFLFLPVVLGLTFLAPRPARNLVLFLASLFFYAAGEGVYALIMVASVIFNYFAGLAIQDQTNPRRRKAWLGVAVAANLAALGWFKYAGFLADNLNGLVKVAHLPVIETPYVHLPAGISFFTFHSLSYVIDVYRGQVSAMRNPLDFGLYISFFPQLIAGPIVRFKTIAKQIVDRRVRLDGFAAGARRFIFGLAKKLIIADTVAQLADRAFATSKAHLTPSLAWLGLICYTLQIYYDFSGYSDMAIGMARMFGFRFLENFRYPYVAQSITEFWRRWHISLSSWFRDYLYIPLGGNRVSPRRTYANLCIVFLLCGIWHGASWTFVVWGLLHGGFLVAERAGLGAWLKQRNRFLRHGYALLVVMIAWVVFRAHSIGAAGTYLLAMFGLTRATADPGLQINSAVLLAIVIGILFSFPLIKWIRAAWLRQVRSAGAVRQELIYVAGRMVGMAVLAMNMILSLMLSAAGTHSPFIYFRF